MNYSKNYEDFRRLHENVSKMTAHWDGRSGSSFEFCDVIVLRSRGRIAGLQLTSRQPCWGTTTKRFPPLETKLFYHANSAKKFFIVLTTNMAALSRGCKRSIM